MSCFRKKSNVIHFIDCHDPETNLSRHTLRFLSQFTHQPEPLPFSFDQGMNINIHGKMSHMNSTFSVDDSLGDKWCYDEGIKDHTTRIIDIYQYKENYLCNNSGMSNYTWSIKISNKNTNELILQQRYTSTNVFIAHEDKLDECLLIHNTFLLTTTSP